MAYDEVEDLAGACAKGHAHADFGGPLADNGGFKLPDGSTILTHALINGSPAINAGLNTGAPSTDQRGFGRSENRSALREFFEVDHRYVIVATLAALARDGKLDPSIVDQAIKAHNINPEKSNPAIS